MELLGKVSGPEIHEISELEDYDRMRRRPATLKNDRTLNDSLKKPTPRSKLRGIYGFLPFGTGRRPTRCFLGTLQRAAGNDQVQGQKYSRTHYYPEYLTGLCLDTIHPVYRCLTPRPSLAAPCKISQRRFDPLQSVGIFGSLIPEPAQDARRPNVQARLVSLRRPERIEGDLEYQIGL